LQCQNGGTLDSLACTCYCPTGTTGYVCGIKQCDAVLTCQNGGYWNSGLCQCDCPMPWRGYDCRGILFFFQIWFNNPQLATWVF